MTEDSPTSVVSSTLGEAWLKSIDKVLCHGVSHYDEDVGIQELLGLTVDISAPDNDDPIIRALGDHCVVERMMKKFSKGIVMNDRPFTYGGRIFDYDGIDQFEWIAEKLAAKPECKSATIGLLIPGDNHPNQPCLTTIDAKIRCGALHLQFFFRSQNIFGRQYANLLALAKLHSDLAVRCSAKIGNLKGYIASAHIYDYDLPHARDILSGSKIPISDQYYMKGPKTIQV